MPMCTLQQSSDNSIFSILKCESRQDRLTLRLKTVHAVDYSNTLGAHLVPLADEGM